MKNESLGLVRVCSVSPNIRLADPLSNAGIILSHIAEAEKNRAGFILFPELTLTGKSCGDLFYQEHLYNAELKALKQILNDSNDKAICIILGIFIKYRGNLINCAAVIQEGEIIGLVPKKYAFTVNDYEDSVKFMTGDSLDNIIAIEFLGKYVAIGNLIFTDESGINIGVEINEELFAPLSPGRIMSQGGAHIIFNPAACPKTVRTESKKAAMILSESIKNNCAYVYASSGSSESTQDMIFGGHCLIAENGEILCEYRELNDKYHPELSLSDTHPDGAIYADIDFKKIEYQRLQAGVKDESILNMAMVNYRNIDLYGIKTISIAEKTLRYYPAMPFIPEDDAKRDEQMSEIFSIQAHSMARRLSAINAKTAVIGISGGLDSTLALLVTAKAFDIIGKPKSDIIAITMPGFGTTDRTYQNALTMMKALGTTVREISIASAVRQHFTDIGHDENIHDITYENSQARERTQILMDIANKESGIVVGTGDLSEAALGWCTFNGDHMSMYNTNGGVPKTLVRFVVKWVMENDVTDKTLKETLQNVLDTPISPELLPPDEDGNIAQKTEDNVGPYELHDFFIYYTLVDGMTPRKLLFAAAKAFDGKYDVEFIKKWMKIFYRRLFTQQFKRNCIPDGPKVGSVNLSTRGGWAIPSDATISIWMKELEKM